MELKIRNGRSKIPYSEQPRYSLTVDYINVHDRKSIAGYIDGDNYTFDQILDYVGKFIDEFKLESVVLAQLGYEYEEFIYNCPEMEDLDIDEKHEFYDSLSTDKQVDLYMKFYDQIKEETEDYISENLPEGDQTEDISFRGNFDESFSVKVTKFNLKGE